MMTRTCNTGSWMWRS